MNRQVFRIRNLFLIPLGIDVILLLMLLLLSVFYKGSSTERMVLSVILIPVALIFIESFSRRVTVDDNGIAIRKFLRIKNLQWQEITHLGLLAMRSKVYFLLTTTKGFYVLSNAYEKYEEMIRHISEHLDKEKVEENIKEQIATPMRNLSNVIGAWVAVIVLAGIIVIKFFPL
jgi:hypothetical protein